MPIVELRDITYVRESQTILSGVSLRIDPGQHWALLGANGSGKTTLLKVITGYEWPSAGEVAVLGERFGECDLRELRKMVGWVSSAVLHQFPAHNTAREVVASGLDASIGLYRDFSAAEWAAAEAALARLGEAAIAHRAYRLLSQGEQQRVLIARALVNRPALLILDEPCAGLDPAARERFLEDLNGVSRQADAPTMILVTHHIEEIGPWISDVLVLRAGRMLATGPREEVLRAEVLAQAFDGRCRVDEVGGRYYLRWEGC
jgi:iron complex transport system ATP-binding protein